MRLFYFSYTIIDSDPPDSLCGPQTSTLGCHIFRQASITLRTAGGGQGGATLIQPLVCEHGIEAESASPDGVRDVFDLVVTQDIEGEASSAGEDAGVVSNSAFVLAVGDIADMMVAIFDAPVISDDVAERSGGWA